MKRTLPPKIVGLSAVLLAALYGPPGLALPLIAIFALLTLAYLLVPVFHPRSNYYIPTVSSRPEAGKVVTLTFDDGPDPRFTPAILDILEREEVQATFFVVGSWAARYPEIIRDIVRRGHILGNHSLRHDLAFHFGRTKNLERDFDAFDRILAEIAGVRCAFFRAPQGFRTPILADVLAARKLRCIAWNARGLDGIRTNAERILAALRPQLRPGSIILLHDGGAERLDRSATLEVLPRLVREIRERGLAFERLDKFLGVAAYESLPSTEKG